MNATFAFDGRTVVVTGAAQGIGLQIARFFREAGADVVPVDWDKAQLSAVWEGSATVLPLDLDVADSEAVNDAVSRVLERFGRIDVVINNAGITRDGVVWKLSDADWDAVLNVHLKGTFNFTRAAIPAMRSAGSGRIINVTSYSGLRGNIGQANYAAAKSAIVGFTKTVAKEVARFGITVNAISPNALTRMVQAVPEEKLHSLTEAIPMGRFGDPAEMVPAFAFLASDEAAYITGVVLPVDGGISV